MSDARFLGVRAATPDDIDALYTFVPMVLGETSLLPLSPSKIEDLIVRCCHRHGGAIAGIIDGKDGAIEASIGLALTESDTSDEKYISAIWCGLHPSLWQRPTNERREIRPETPRDHYGRRLFQFARWCHEALEKAAEKPILMRVDLLTTQQLWPKLGLYQRNMPQVGASFAFGASGAFKPQAVPAEAAA